MNKKDTYTRQTKHILANYKTKNLQIKNKDFEILNKNLKEKNINFRQLILNFLKKEGLFDE